MELKPFDLVEIVKIKVTGARILPRGLVGKRGRFYRYRHHHGLEWCICIVFLNERLMQVDLLREEIVVINGNNT